ncbi:hypothetical protein G7K_5974-t1 [Saitoella complicata NRRL Y-17804]|uniref:Cytochrome b5 heme-binding domain-containing protein n=1 Tax=Saitoella complicata (strain BCRC 22490 / CBS 7301 / JCM 7358 / NBRC 10748 / NRRL Y-17804) TaxID=698492 RepID=A0A0E9NQ15_SAICN|nr:hypothetical protein G7K_5974-t1 [Saitoella complicata NRRL Y-17804]
MAVMSPEVNDLAPPKDDPYTTEQLAECDGSDESKPIWLAIRGLIYDVTRNKSMYGPGAGYNIFAGKDASRGLAKSSLKNEDARGEVEGLTEAEMKVLSDWEGFFQKRYNIVGRLIDGPNARP